MTKSHKILLVAAILLGDALILGYFYTHHKESSTAPIAATSTIPVATSTPATSTTTVSTTPKPTTPAVLPYGAVTLSLNQKATFKDISIRPVAIVSDSRCPSDVQCIQAGTVRVSVQITSGMGISNQTIELGKSITTEAETVTLTEVQPNKISTKSTSDSSYRLTFTVTKTAPVSIAGKCYVGGCSAQLCTDHPDTISTCEYTNSYACYKTATCERQSTGQCGWTQTSELQACLVNAQ